MGHGTSNLCDGQISLFSECLYCQGMFVAKTSRSKHCSEKCRYRTRERSRMFPCAICGELMHSSRNSLPVGQAAHRRCKYPDAANHGSVARYRRGCRCDECRAASAAAVRDWTRKNNYWSKPDVMARRSSQRSTTEARAKERERYRRYYEANRSVMIRQAADRWAKRKGAPTIPFTVAQLEDRLSMFDGCWMCGCELDGELHIDHVKPLSKGGWHCLSNLRPSCPSCNLSKGAKWPLEKVMLTV